MAYRTANKDAIHAHNQAYRKANKDAIYAHNQAYRKANREVIKTRGRKYRIKKSNQFFALFGTWEIEPGIYN